MAFGGGDAPGEQATGAGGDGHAAGGGLRPEQAGVGGPVGGVVLVAPALDDP